MNIFVILPTHLFEKKYLNIKYNYIIWEHSHYFKSYIYNKKKIILHRASMMYYYDYLKSNKFNVKYVPYDKKQIIKYLIQLIRLNCQENMRLLNRQIFC